MKLPACAAVVLAVGAGLGTYFALGVPPEPQVPKMHKNALLEAATSKGIIGGYRAIRHQWGVYSYESIDSDITLEYPNACGDRSCPQSTPILWVEYGADAQSQARRLLRIARARWSGKIQTFDIEHLDSHTPDARIMLIPKAGA